LALPRPRLSSNQRTDLGRPIGPRRRTVSRRCPRSRPMIESARRDSAPVGDPVDRVGARDGARERQSAAVRRAGACPKGPPAHVRRGGERGRVGCEYCHSIIDDHTRIASTEIHPDQTAPDRDLVRGPRAGVLRRLGITARRLQTDRQRLGPYPQPKPGRPVDRARVQPRSQESGELPAPSVPRRRATPGSECNPEPGAAGWVTVSAG
jgi:hypothetical protein